MILINEPKEFCRVPRISAAAAGNPKADMGITCQQSNYIAKSKRLPPSLQIIARAIWLISGSL
jgi:hypothetical protein